MNTRDWVGLSISIVLAEAAGAIGALFTTSEIPMWYATLVKPTLNPPAWVFGPVWTTLFVLMGIAAFLVWRKGVERGDVKKALAVYGLQLVVNVLWSVAFFGSHNPKLAFSIIVVLWLAIVVTIFAFARVSKVAAYLLIPYLLWVSFAGYLNLQIVTLNSGASAVTSSGALGQEFVQGYTHITPLELVEDSRCPVDVQCIQAGTVRVRAAVNTYNRDFIFTLKVPQTIDGAVITLDSVVPATKHSKVSVPPSDYRFLFTVK